MHSRNVALLLAMSSLLASSLLHVNARPCSTFLLRQRRELLFGKNYDMLVKEGCILVNKRGVAKASLSPRARMGSCRTGGKSN